MSPPVVALNESASLPVFLQIARSIASDIRRRRLVPGARLPGSRSLADSLGVHRNTVLAAFAELEQEGWIVTKPARGTFVADALPHAPPRRFGTPKAPSGRVELDLAEPWPSQPYEVPANRPVPLIGGMADLRLVPTAALARAYRTALRLAPRTLGYGPENGHPELRSALATLLRDTRGIKAGPEDVFVTRGSQMAIFLAARSVASPGSLIAVEALGYRPAWEGMRLAGARLAPIPIDSHGLRVDALRQLTERERIAAVYVTPHHQYPTTITMSAGRRLELLALAAERRFAIIEDDYDHEFHYTGRPILPLASADEAGVVVYVGTLSKVFVPGVRVGYTVARPEVLDRMRRIRWHIDRQGDLTLEWAIASLIEDGELGRHMRRVRRHYGERRDALLTALRQELGGAIDFHEPAGGMALWVRALEKSGTACEAWVARTLTAGVLVHPGRRFDFQGRALPFLRLGFAALTPQEIRKAVRVLASAYDA